MEFKTYLKTIAFQIFAFCEKIVKANAPSIFLKYIFSTAENVLSLDCSASEASELLLTNESITKLLFDLNEVYLEKQSIVISKVLQLLGTATPSQIEITIIKQVLSYLPKAKQMLDTEDDDICFIHNIIEDLILSFPNILKDEADLFTLLALMTAASDIKRMAVSTKFWIKLHEIYGDQILDMHGSLFLCIGSLTRKLAFPTDLFERYNRKEDGTRKEGNDVREIRNRVFEFFEYLGEKILLETLIVKFFEPIFNEILVQLKNNPNLGNWALLESFFYTFTVCLKPESNKECSRMEFVKNVHSIILEIPEEMRLVKKGASKMCDYSNQLLKKQY